jgi:polyribonucleotide nucleotidyltransferase
MDFKVTGTRDGICGIQMDIKVDGLSMDVMRSALAQANAGRMHILDAMYACIPEKRADLKPHAPRMEFWLSIKNLSVRYRTWWKNNSRNST